MPELPEVETTARGIRPHLEGKRFTGAEVRQPKLRWPVPRGLSRTLAGATIESVSRRAKYILIGTDRGHLILHLGMSGSLRVLPRSTPAGKHDHVDLLLDSGRVLRLNDPRRFGAVLHTRRDPSRHELIAELGPEPLSSSFDAEHLHQLSRGRRAPVKSFIMDGHVVVGVGNIYASEALHRAGIHPRRAAGRIALPRYERLVDEIREVLSDAIRAGGTTLKDFTSADGSPGYFGQQLDVYDRDGLPCNECGTAIRSEVISQRNTYWCPSCQR
jgi:formamidopyrimidine-DNA glycosylase